MHHVAVTLNDHEVGDLHTAVFADAADVVAGEVHEHHVLGAFFGVGEQIFFVGQILGGRGAARARAGDGADLYLAFLAAHVNFR